jgi:hypothetical protein
VCIFGSCLIASITVSFPVDEFFLVQRCPFLPMTKNKNRKYRKDLKLVFYWLYMHDGTRTDKHSVLSKLGRVRQEWKEGFGWSLI